MRWRSSPGTICATILTYVNQGGKWEKTETWNVGVDASFWHGLLTVTADAFIRDTKDMLRWPCWQSGWPRC